MSKQQPAQPKWPPFNPFVRQETTRIGKTGMILGSVLVPFRLFGAIATLTAGLVWCSLCSIGCDTSKPYPPLRRSLLVGGCGYFSRILLFFFGFVWVKQEYEIADAKERQKQPIPSLVVVNHIGFAELLYLVWSDGCCFVSKDTNKALPFIGKISAILQSIFVDRGEGRIESAQSAAGGSSNTGGSSTTAKILERAHSPPGTWPPLAMCPEGTTHTGHCLITFATGAFRAGLPVQPVVVSSPFNPIFGYDPSFSCADIVLHVLGLMTQTMNQLHVKHLAVYVPNEKEKADPSLYASNVREKMAKELGVKSYDLTWTDKLQFEPSKKARELGREKLAARNGGIVPPTPIFTHDPFGNPLHDDTKKEN
eukprot:CAMPEP_0113481954 /NCGR_PEP_ID=MMETSP0014_2-20120614/22672_1 /TAXON_ID=2857 /ORGANISM="Nitzschia sp." /LENGTH=365 /DNA_ID=CAMNT_0000375461 /DNA_START=178 /DNA_END=1275 /DNA_ORIENTATION=- /assembly_acc=CAM_ASM_000159